MSLTTLRFGYIPDKSQAQYILSSWQWICPVIFSTAKNSKYLNSNNFLVLGPTNLLNTSLDVLVFSYTAGLKFHSWPDEPAVFATGLVRFATGLDLHGFSLDAKGGGVCALLLTAPREKNLVNDV